MKSVLTVSLSPHEKGKLSVPTIMWSVVIALLPAFGFSIYYFGFSALQVVLVSVASCMAVEYLVTKFLLKRETTVNDGSAAICGLLLAFNLPANIPLWEIVVGSIIAIGVAKLAFGGLGNNPFNPALIGRAFMLASFPADMTSWPLPLTPDALTGPTPLGFIKEGLAKGIGTTDLMQELPNYWRMFFGSTGGCIGETCAIAIIAGGIFLLIRKIISWRIPFFYLGTLFLFTGIFWLINPAANADPLFHILTGGAMLGAWFMATDMVTSPMSAKGQIIFAVGGGLICGIIRIFGSYPEGCSYSILIMNALVPLIDRRARPRIFGTGGSK
jgi:Na+-translocating ferredoxin:NAD+ oxidoreductase subunit D